mgnify:FL=1
MSSALKRSIAFLLVLVLAISMIPTAFAAEVEPTDSTVPDAHATDPPEETTSENTLPVSQTEPETISLQEEEMDYWALDNSIAVFAEAEISGAPNAFANLTLPSGGIDIPAQGYIQHKNILPLYSVYLKNQTGYANNYYVAYCIEPGVELGNTGHSGTAYTLDSMTEGSGAMYRLSREKVEAIGVALMYGQRDIASKNDEQSLRYEKLCRHAATQAIIWEIACGWRSPYPPYTLWDSTLYDAITPSLYCASSVWGTTFYLDGMDDAYRVIANQMAQHYTIPSFMEDSQAAAPSYMLTPDGTGKYSITLTDTNGILNQYSFSNTSDLTFSVSGNKLTVTANAPVSNVIVAPTKHVPDLNSQVFFVWEHGTQQKLMSCKTEPVYSAMPAYFSVNVPPQTGNLSLTKTTEDGKNLSGWQFGIYSNSSCTTLVSGPHTTDSSGAISVTGLSAGTYYVKELGHTDSTINALYYCSSTNPQPVTVTAGATATVSFTNKLNTGSVKLIKSTNTGANLSGWQIGLYTDADCTNAVSGSPYTTGADGTVTVSGLQKGTYYAKEIPKDDPYWAFDTAVKSVTVAVGQTTEVTFTNTHYGRIEIRKTTNTGNQLGGWTFRVKDSNGNTVGDFTTDDNGYACTGNLPLGRYTVVELPTEDNYWLTELGFHDVTVKAGETTVDTWLNKEQGLAWFYKKTNTGQSVEGWHITVYTDEACTQKVGTLITNEDGRAGYYLDPGTYWAKETGDEHGRFEDEYWMVDETVQKFEIKPHEDVSITFTNVQHGRLKITKTVEGGGSVEGWQFKITDAEGKGLDGSPFATDEDGIILTGNLLPGQYTVEELLPEDSLYECKGENPQTITVKQGEIAEVSFTNAMRSGKITIEKIDTAGEHLAGATFLLEWSAEGSLWYPVQYSKELTKGACSNSALVDGTLTSGEDGILEWDNLYPGLHYRVTELKAPNGYELLTDYAFEGTLPSDDLQVSLQVVNAKGFSLPDTGASTGLILRILQLACAAACAALLLISYKKKRW